MDSTRIRQAIGTVVVAVLALLATEVGAQDPPQRGQHEYTFSPGDGTVDVRYTLFLPDTYGESSSKIWPLIVHIGGSGTDISNRFGPAGYAEERPDFPFIVLSLQPPFFAVTFEGIDRLISQFSPVLDDIVRRHAVDEDRVYLAGGSLGGYVGWIWPHSEPTRFAAMVSLAGAPNETLNPCVTRSMPVYQFHGGGDSTVPLAPSIQVTNDLRACGGEINFTIRPDWGHTDVGLLWLEATIYDLLLRHTRQALSSEFAIDAVDLLPSRLIEGAGTVTVSATTQNQTPGSGAIDGIIARFAYRGDLPDEILRDDGTGRDAVAGDGVYTGTLNIPTEWKQGFYGIGIELIDADGGRNAFHKRLEIGPRENHLVFDEDWAQGWAVRYSSVDVDPQDDMNAYSGNASLRVAASGLVVDIRPETPISLAGCETLRLAIHPSGATAPTRRPNLSISINNWRDGGVNLLDTTSSIRVDLDRQEWQILEFPLDQIARHHDLLENINILGNVKGDFRIDDIRIIRRPRAAQPTAVTEETDIAAVPPAFNLLPNAPNPFNSGTMIRFNLAREGSATLTIYNLTGQRVTTLLEGSIPAGSQSVHWDGRDDDGRHLATGTYVYRLETEMGVQTRKLTLLR